MDFDEPIHGKPTGAASLVLELLDDLSVFELKERLEILQAEIARTEKAIESKEVGQSDADKLFR
ncbi:MAG: DUF1192 domain-containing protein [Alphaproteobacteria bacterium]|nr:MAG: DUF1192 domain-containing protein [Alphaproteobacteria bacterium]